MSTVKKDSNIMVKGDIKMGDVKWIKIVTDIFNDEKMLLIESLPDSDSIMVIWFKLLCLAGKNNNSGVFTLNGKITYTNEMFATVFRRNVNTVRLAMQTFENFGMIEIVNDVVTIPNWGKHQNLEGAELAKEKTKSRVREFRKRQKTLALTDGNADVTPCNVTECYIVTDGNADRIEKRREEKIREDNNTPPTPPRGKKNGEDAKKELTEVRACYKFAGELDYAVNSWIKYKHEKRQGYKPEGLRNFLSQVRNNAEKFGDIAVISVIKSSMAANYQGVTWDKLKTAQGGVFHNANDNRGIQHARPPNDEYARITSTKI